jgi:hypothetical protein
MPRQTPSDRRRGPALLLVLVLAVAAAGLFVWLRSTSDSGTAETDPSAAGITRAPEPTGQPASTTPAAATTSRAASAGTSGTVGTDSPSPASTTAVSASAEVGVSTTYAGWDDASSSVVVAGFVTGVIEEGGTCTATLTRGSQTEMSSTTASADATTTTCGDITVGGLDSGSWQAVLSYESGAAHGTSAAVTVDVP